MGWRRRGAVSQLAARRGKSKAAVAVGHTILVIAYHLLTQETDYRDLGPDYFDGLDQEAVARRLIRRLERLGYKVSRPETMAAA